MGFERADDYIARCGDSLLFVEKGVCGYESNSFIGANFRYLTVQVFDADKAIREIVARGGLPGSPAIDFRDVARYGFVRDPDGNWIEISARRSLINAYEKY
jgi:lactoylglutathione lyase